MTTVLDVDSNMPPVEPVKVSTPRKPPQQPKQRKTVNPRFAVAVEVLNELEEIYTEQAEYIESKAFRKGVAGPDRMVAGFLSGARAASNPIEYLTDRIGQLTYTVGELRSAMTEVIREEQRVQRAKLEGKA